MMSSGELVSGVEFTYYHLCRRKLFLFTNNISFEGTNQDVKLGKIIENTYYKRASKSKGIEDINLDKVDFKKGIVYEVKKSSKHKDIDQWQGKYYLYYLERVKRFVLKKAVIQYPEERLSIDCYLTEDDKETIENILGEIEAIKGGKLPLFQPSHLCKRCAYYEFCYV